LATSSRNLTQSRFAPQYGYFGKFDQPTLASARSDAAAEAGQTG
jgi:hypothetical protein